jgi:hypothetical protein
MRRRQVRRAPSSVANPKSAVDSSGPNTESLCRAALVGVGHEQAVSPIGRGKVGWDCLRGEFGRGDGAERESPSALSI